MSHLHWGRPAPDSPSAILLHGLTSSSRTWLDLGTHLSDRYEVHAPEQRGHGTGARLPRTDGEFAIDRFARDALEFINTLKLRPAILAGHSWGAAATLIAAAALSVDPETAPAAVILEDPVHAMGTARQRAMAARMLSLRDLDTDSLRIELTAGEPSLTDHQLIERVEELRATDPALLRHVAADPAERSLLPLFAEIACPVLLLLADETLSRVFDDDTVERARPLLPAGSHVVRVSGAPHVVHRAEPERTAAEIDAFLKTVD